MSRSTTKWSGCSPNQVTWHCFRNLRPIAMLPVLYKLFARMVYSRIWPTLLSTQSLEQCAFTPRVRLEDALCTVEIAIRYCSELNKSLWMMSMDMYKAFNSIEHEAALHALIQQDVDPAYVALIATLYKPRIASVDESQELSVGRDVRQEDVSSSILCNCVIDVVFQ